MEVCAVKCKFLSSTFCILAFYRSPSSNFSLFITQLEVVINKIYKPNLLMIVCGDFNINYLEDNKMKQQLNYILQSFNLSSVVYFPTRTCTTTQTLIDNIFIDITKFENYLISPVFNGLSDHDGQLLFVHQKEIRKERTNCNCKIIWTFNNCSLNDFKLSLSFETWETVFNADNNNIDSVFNNFVDVYLQIFNACFPKKKTYEHFSSKQWLTTGIKTSCRRKRELYLLAKFHDNENLKQYYKSYCKILTKVINEAKRLSNEDKITNSNNVAKTTWNIIRAELGKDCSVIHSLLLMLVNLEGRCVKS
ncbi:hypothetical protein B7P43_G03730 [Cryptotermes secundus]|uniref:Endonuclease/exonuclease/phosphatase domain-containing protein n=1 Tax=Cryptotermes secundus TaxID=105785 RepID=A0A2J7R1U6_9NEOP|nr:hypothetical protein B7P43_G03730 [Cryptotermes secundus]